MNNKDQEAFENYIEENKSIYFGMPKWEIDTDKTIWQAACEYKHKEIEELIGTVNFKAKVMCDVNDLVLQNKKLQAENAKLKEYVMACKTLFDGKLGKEWGDRARKLLNQVGEK